MFSSDDSWADWEPLVKSSNSINLWLEWLLKKVPGYSVVVFLPASSHANLPVGGIEVVVKETVDKRKNQKLSLPITTKQQQKDYRKEGETKEMVQSSFSLQSDVIMRREASAVLPQALDPIFQWEQEDLSTK